ncbi:MAG TPA: GTP-binding protein [Steroidobacteraceae bacterium]|nr:GTP-binding protein [Steroidobacteraceae bacterium]
MTEQHSARPDVHTPVTLLTGFLGSGKTTLLNRALRDPAMARTMIVVNEFGEISIDHALTQVSNDSIVVLENGCLCCTVFGDLVQTFNQLWLAREAGEIAFDHVVIETSGLAEPAPVLQAFLSQPLLAGLWRVGAVVTTVDAINGPHTLDQHPVSVAQAALADHLLITKLDLLEPGERDSARAALTARLRTINATASISAVDDPSADPMRLLRSVGPDPGGGPESAAAWLAHALGGRGEGAGGEGGHAHEPEGHGHEGHDEHEGHGHEGHAHAAPASHAHEDAISTFNLIRETPLPREAVQLLLSSLERHLGPKLLRVKGLIHVAEEPEQPAVIQGAQHLLHNLTWLPRWPDADRRTRIVFITQGIAPDELSEMVNLLDRVAQRTAAARARAATPPEAGVPQ